MANPHARIGTTKDENKDLTDFSLRLCASARDIFFGRKRKLKLRVQEIRAQSFISNKLMQLVAVLTETPASTDA